MSHLSGDSKLPGFRAREGSPAGPHCSVRSLPLGPQAPTGPMVLGIPVVDKHLCGALEAST